MSNYFIAWQEYPRKTGVSGLFRIQTDNTGLAKTIRERKKSSECKVIGIKMYLFQLEFSNKEKAIISLNNLLGRNNYPKLKYNANMGVFISNIPPDIVAKKETRSKNG
jgi:ssDNA-binding Zn-finger/Zn-ribbon topoisomerase 1